MRECGGGFRVWPIFRRVGALNKGEAFTMTYDVRALSLELWEKPQNEPGSIDSSCLKNLIMNFMCCRCSFMPAGLEGRGLPLD
jgi:hypothetical protein